MDYGCKQNTGLFLYDVWGSQMKLLTLKLLDIYLLHRAGEQKNMSVLNLDRSKVENMLGVERIRNEVLDKSLKRLCMPVSIRGYTDGCLFDDALRTTNDIVMSGSTFLEELLTGNPCWIPVGLEKMLGCSERYIYVMYRYLMANSEKRVWNVGLDELKYILGCTAGYYSDYKHFNYRVLKTAHRQLEQLEAIKYTYDTIRRDRRVCELHFTLIS